MKTDDFFKRIDFFGNLFRNIKAKYVQSSEDANGLKNVKSNAKFSTESSGFLQLLIFGGLILSFFIFPEKLNTNYADFKKNLSYSDTIISKLDLLTNQVINIKKKDSILFQSKLNSIEGQLINVKDLVCVRESLINKEFIIEIVVIVMTSIIWIFMFLFLLMSIRKKSGKKADVWL